ncbi:MAG: ABC transporter permease [Arachnia propionica]|nr:MAG: ABC transporter permease [Arachnia propionica]
MLKFVGKRLGISLLVLFLGSLLLYVLTINSGDPLQDLRESNDPNRENLIKQRTLVMGLDMPWYVRYFVWLRGAAGCIIGQCNLGVNRAGQDVTELVKAAAASTLQLVIGATLIAIVVGITLGIVTAIRQYSGFDYGVTMMVFVFFSLPVFWVAVLLKEYAAIQFNDWIATAKFEPTTIIISSLILAFILGAVVGGSWTRRLITFAVAAVSFTGIFFYFNAVTWFRRPALGIPVYILLVIGAAALVIVLTSGFQNPKVRNAVGATALVAIIGYMFTRGLLMSSPTFGLLALFAAIAIAAAVLSGLIFGGFSKRQAIFSSIVTSIMASVAALIDLLLSNWSAYLQLLSRPISTIGASTPNLEAGFWVTHIDTLTHLVLPTTALVLISIAGYTRYTRSSMLEVLNQDYIRTARSKGLSERAVIMRHAVRNSLIPLATIVAFDFAGLIGGAVITETVFGWKGMGALFKEGLVNVDPAPVMGFFLVTGTAAVTMNMLADIAYAFLDPRITR